jgi:hypothetical protein
MGAPSLKALNRRGWFYDTATSSLPFFTSHFEVAMDLSPLVNVMNSPLMDEVLIWVVALVAGSVSVVALVNALDMFLDAEPN